MDHQHLVLLVKKSFELANLKSGGHYLVDALNPHLFAAHGCLLRDGCCC